MNKLGYVNDFDEYEKSLLNLMWKNLIPDE